ncbi:MAG: hypothetical protein ACRDF4_11795, partial [Rhabdochlamydiaceae bacterium]
PEGSKGIYSAYIPDICGRPNPMIAVGYALSELNASDVLPPSGFTTCTAPSTYDIFVGVTNIQVGYVPFVYSYRPIPRSESVNYSSSQAGQDVTFKLPFQSFSVPATVSYDQNLSHLVRFSLNPELYNLQTGSCSWSVSNVAALRAGSSNASMSGSDFTINAPPVRIPPNTNGTFTITMQFKNLSVGSFYALDLYAIESTTGTNSSVIPLASYFPITSAASELNATSVSGSC